MLALFFLCLENYVQSNHTGFSLLKVITVFLLISLKKKMDGD